MLAALIFSFNALACWASWLNCATGSLPGGAAVAGAGVKLTAAITAATANVPRAIRLIRSDATSRMSPSFQRRRSRPVPRQPVPAGTPRRLPSWTTVHREISTGYGKHTIAFTASPNQHKSPSRRWNHRETRHRSAFVETVGGYYSIKAADPLDPPEYGRDEKIQAELWQTAAALVDGSSPRPDDRRHHRALRCRTCPE